MPPVANLGRFARAAIIDATAATAKTGPANGMLATELAAPEAAAAVFAVASAFFAVVSARIAGKPCPIKKCLFSNFTPNIFFQFRYYRFENFKPLPILTNQ